MLHQMNLHDNPFSSIKAGTKDIEMRLYDEKRRKINIGDEIEFTNNVTGEKVTVVVVNIHVFETFDEMYLSFNKIRLGYKENEQAKSTDMSKFYNEEEIRQFNVVGIEIKLK